MDRFAQHDVGSADGEWLHRVLGLDEFAMPELSRQNADQRLILAEPGHETGSATANEAGNRSWRKDSDLLQRVRRKSVANPLR